MDKSLSISAVDALIDKDHTSVDENLQKMQETYSAEELDKMSPSEFYRNYKRLVGAAQ